ncbi:vomeronasal type-1 receptor 100-like [Ornithorhynchus anatinus]|uniref:vomeronasal type-1 receptor 100-like n=1 Tax=Ornithorhynchus anatinus TaxID=9258 RepID=UPI0010A8461B|nr:vomeronasal type-1 receptor 100-like [Ornithorhynchus anatinus]
MFLLGLKAKPTDLIIIHLALVHIMMLLPGGIITAAEMFGLQLIHSDFGCAILSYLIRVSRGLSICTTCLLSVVQAITISPSNSHLFQLKVSIPQLIFPGSVILWIPNLLISTNLLFQLVISHNVTSIHANCLIVPINTFLQSLILSLMTLCDVLSMGLMSCSSGHMVLLLLQHHRQVQHLHSFRLSSENSPERRATQTITLLVIGFVSFYFGDFILSMFLGTTMKNDASLSIANTFVVNGYATLSPFVLLTCDTRIIKSLSSVSTKFKWDL